MSRSFTSIEPNRSTKAKHHRPPVGEGSPLPRRMPCFAGGETPPLRINVIVLRLKFRKLFSNKLRFIGLTKYNKIENRRFSSEIIHYSLAKRLHYSFPCRRRASFLISRSETSFAARGNICHPCIRYPWAIRAVPFGDPFGNHYEARDLGGRFWCINVGQFGSHITFFAVFYIFGRKGCKKCVFK